MQKMARMFEVTICDLKFCDPWAGELWPTAPISGLADENLSPVSLSGVTEEFELLETQFGAVDRIIDEEVLRLDLVEPGYVTSEEKLCDSPGLPT